MDARSRVVGLAILLTAATPHLGAAQFRWPLATATVDSAQYLPLYVEIYRGSSAVPMSIDAITDSVTTRLQAAGYRIADLGGTRPHPSGDRATLRLDFWPEGGVRGEVSVECPLVGRAGFTDGPNRAWLEASMVGAWFARLVPAPLSRRACAPT
jgi:hypothetical protein